MVKVLSVGIATVDTIVLVDKYPAADERVVALQSVRAVGGPATTAAVTMARLGIDVSLSCVIGDDEDGRFIFDTLNVQHYILSEDNPLYQEIMGTMKG